MSQEPPAREFDADPPRDGEFDKALIVAGQDAKRMQDRGFGDETIADALLCVWLELIRRTIGGRQAASVLEVLAAKLLRGEPFDEPCTEAPTARTAKQAWPALSDALCALQRRGFAPDVILDALLSLTANFGSRTLGPARTGELLDANARAFQAWQAGDDPPTQH